MWSDWSVWVSFLFFRVFSQSCRRFSTGEPPTPTPKLEKTELFSCCLFVDDVISIVQSALVISSGRGLLPGPRPLPFLLVTGGGYLGYKQYQKWGQGEDGAPPPVATPTQVKWKFSLMSSHLPCNTEHVQSDSQWTRRQCLLFTCDVFVALISVIGRWQHGKNCLCEVKSRRSAVRWKMMILVIRNKTLEFFWVSPQINRLNKICSPHFKEKTQKHLRTTYSCNV